MRYYTLTFLTHDRLHRKGDRQLVGSSKALVIGTHHAADIRLDAAGDEPAEPILTILPTKAGNGWCVVTHTTVTPVCVGGRQVTIAAPIADGEHLSIGRTELRFNVHEDEHYTDANGTRREEKKAVNGLLYTTFVCLLFVTMTMAVVAVHWWWTKDDERFTREDIIRCEDAVYHIYVDSLELQQHIDGKWCRMDAIKPSRGVAGTCFLAKQHTDSLTSFFVTARHCVEYWLADSEWAGEADSTKQSREVTWAVMVENANYPDKEVYRLVSQCSVMKDNVVYASFESSQCHFNRSRDIVSDLSTGDDHLFWRFLFPLFKNREVELGDFTFIEAPDSLRSKTTLIMADTLFMQEQLKDINTFKLFGFPDNNSTLNVVWENDGRFQQNHDERRHTQGWDAKGCLPLTVNANHGNSGGPVVVKRGGEMRVVGIMSKEDDHSKGATFWCVPINEVTEMLQHGGMANKENDFMLYRR